MKTIRQIILGVMAAAFACGAHAQTNAAGTFRLAGKVVDAEGRPVTDAVVEAYQSAGDTSFGRGDFELKQRVTTGTNGAFEFSLARAATVMLARKAGLAPAWKQYWSLTKDVADERLVLTAPTTLAGVVVDEADKPVADAEVFVSIAFTEVSLEGRGRTFHSMGGKLARNCFATRTSAEGRFRIEGFPTNATADLAVKVPGKALRQPRREYSGPDSMQSRAGDQDIKLTVEPAGSIEGKVVAQETGQPALGVRLWLQSGGPSFYDTAEREPVQSSADGTFRFGDMAAGSYHIRAVFGTNALADWVAETVPVSVEPGQTNRDAQITATRGGLLEVAVLGKNDRKPLAQVGVNAYRQTYQSAALSSSDGTALLRLPPGEYQVSANKENWHAENVTATVEAGKTNRVEIELAPPLKVTGVVRDPAGAPVAGLKVILVGAGYGRPDAPEIKTDANGRFEMEWDPRRYGRSDMTFCLLIRDAERNLAVAQEIDEETGPLELQLAPGLTLAGRVECDGQPITNVSATLVFWTGNSGMYLPGFNIKSNVPGCFEIPALPPDRRYGVNVSASGYGQKSINVAEAEAGRVELDPVELKVANLKLGGQVSDVDDKPVAGAHVNLYGEGQPSANTRTDRDGRFSFDKVCEGPAQLSANARDSFGNVTAEGGDTNVVLRLGESAVTYGGGAQPKKLKGTVTTPDGEPAASVQVKVFSAGPSRPVKTDTNGAFNLTWSVLPVLLGSPCVIALDPKHNLAVAEDITEDTTTVSLQLKPGLTVTERVEDPNGKPLTNATVQVQLRAGNVSGTFDTARIAIDAQGRFEINTLPPDRQYMLWVTAKGYGSSHQEVGGAEGETNRIELAPVVLKVADRKLAGRVVNAEDKPVSGVNVYMYGDGQPSGSVFTDKAGRFAFDQVCEGEVRLSASWQSSYGNARTEGGDTNAVIVLGSSSGLRRAPPRRAALTSRSLPDLAAVNLASDAVPAGKPVLLCLFDLEQRPSRRCVRLLAEQHDALKEKGLTVLAVQAMPTTAEALQAWKDANPVPFPAGCVPDKSDKTKWASGVESLPWLILADAQGRVIAEGFALDELDAKLKALGR